MKTRIKIFSYLLIIFFFTGTGTFAQNIKNKAPKKDKPVSAEKKINIENLKSELGPDWENIIVTKMKKEEPERLEKIERSKTKNPSKYYNELAKFWNQTQRKEKMKEKDSKQLEIDNQQRQMEQKSKQLAQEYRTTQDETRKSQIKDELYDCLSELFTLRENRRAEKVKELEKEIENLKTHLAYRDKNKEKIINERLNMLISKDEKLKW